MGTTQRRGKPVILVVAAALIDPSDRILVAQRPAGKDLAGMWEFPGGKVEQGETPEQALCREFHEELAVDLDVASLEPLTFASHGYDRFHLLMPLYLCRRWQGKAVGCDGQALAWAKAQELDAYPMPPADVPLVAALKARLECVGVSRNL